jgi:hypothetical protein
MAVSFIAASGFFQDTMNTVNPCRTKNATMLFFGCMSMM